ncbi:ATP-dependent DNA helicase II subunit 1 [Agyrium rufum]|nr:ATP-dependent DNA helicase II subunit 1 [Agyrium rufum]
MADSERNSSGYDNQEDEEEEEVDDTVYKSVKDAVIFAIEVSASMLEKPPPSDSKKADHDSPVSAAVKCAFQLMQQRIISHPNDMMGILLYGTEKTKFHDDDRSTSSGMAFPHCYLLTDLDIPSAEDVKALKSLVEDEHEFKKVMVPAKERIQMSSVLFCANQIFTVKAPNFLSRRLFLVTDEDDPHAGNRDKKQSAAVRAKDLYDLGVFIDLFPISKPDLEFDRSKFYNDIIYSSTPTDAEAPLPLTSATKTSRSGDGITLLQSLLSSINSRSIAKRTLFSNLPLEIAPGFRISVKGYIMFKRQTPARTSYIWLQGEQAQIVEGVTTQMADDTARVVQKTEMKKAYKFGGEQILFTPEELSTLRHFGDPGITIIGFKPQSMLPFWANLKNATFIYPSEEDYVGSTRVFSALQQKLLKDEKMAVAWFVARKNAAPQIVAIWPGAEKLDEEGVQKVPPGLWIIPLPFADDIRIDPEIDIVRASDDLINRMRKVVQQLQLPKAQYRPENYPNPSLQWHYRILQAMALDEDLPEHPEDKTIPRYKQIDKRAGPYVMEWGQDLEAEYQEYLESNPKSNPFSKSIPKRPALSAKDMDPRPTKKTRPDAGEIDDQEMSKRFKDDTIKKLTVAQLKAWMGFHGMDTGGNKAILVEQVESYFEHK